MQIDPRGPQFNAILTSVVLALVLLTAPDPSGSALLAVQAVLFAVGVGLGVQRTPSAWLFKTFVRPRLAAPAHLEDPEPPRFAQGVGLVFAVVGLAGYLLRARPARSRRHRVRPGGGPAQRGLRVLPGLRDVPAPQAR